MTETAWADRLRRQIEQQQRAARPDETAPTVHPRRNAPGREMVTRSRRRPVVLIAPRDLPAWLWEIPSGVLFSKGVAGFVERHGLPRPTMLELASVRAARSTHEPVSRAA